MVHVECTDDLITGEEALGSGEGEGLGGGRDGEGRRSEVRINHLQAPSTDEISLEMAEDPVPVETVIIPDDITPNLVSRGSPKHMCL